LRKLSRVGGLMCKVLPGRLEHSERLPGVMLNYWKLLLFSMTLVTPRTLHKWGSIL
jgi:hypothetical protein